MKLVLRLTAAPLLLFAAACSNTPSDPAEAGAQAFEQGDYAAARLYLIEAVSANPGNQELRLQLAETLLTIGDFVGAEAALAELPDSERETGANAALMAQALLLQERPEEALEWAEKAGDDQPRAHWVRAGVMLGEGKVGEAEAALDNALETHGDDPSLLALRGEIALERRAVEAARDYANRALAVDEHALDALMLAGKLALLREDFEAAKEHYQLAVDQHRGVVGPLVALGAVQADIGETDAAQETIQRLREIAPTHPIARYMAARLAFVDEDLEEAHALLQQDERALQEIPAAQLLRGEIAHLRGNHEEAISVLRPFMRENPLHMQGAMVLAQSYLVRGDAEAAFKVIEAPATRASATPQLLALAGKLAKQTGRADRFATRVADKAPPADLEARLARADRAIAARDWSAAHDLYLSLIKDGVDTNAMVLNNAAITALESQRKPQALAHAKAAYALTPDDPDVIDTYGWVMLQAGSNKAEALKLLGRALEKSPGNLEYRWHYAAALAANGRTAEAKRQARAVREFAGPAQRDHIDRLLASL